MKTINVNLSTLFKVLGAIGLFILIWFGGDLLKIFDQRWAFTLAEKIVIICSIIVSLFIIFLINYYLKSYKEGKIILQLIQGQDTSASIKNNDIRSFRKYTLTIFRTLKISKQWRGKKDQSFINLPCFFLIGPTQSGKTLAVLNSDLNFPFLENKKKEALPNKFQNFEWLLTDKAILLNVSLDLSHEDNIINTDTTDKQEWNTLLPLLKKYRKNLPLNGVVFTLSLPDLILMSEGDQKVLFNILESQIHTMQKILRVPFPIYILFTKCDLVSGFGEFFGTLTVQEREQPWGLVFNENIAQGTYERQFIDKFAKNIRRINNKMLRILSSQATQPQYDRIVNFPNQMRLFEYPIASLIRRVFDIATYREPLQLRGVYFSSARQGDPTYDFCLAACNQFFDLNAPIQNIPLQNSRAFFLKGFFNDIISCNSDWIRESKIVSRMKILLRTTAAITLLAGAVGGLILLIQVYNLDKKYLAQIKENLILYNNKESLYHNKNMRISDVLPLLQPLRDSYETSLKLQDINEHFKGQSFIVDETYAALKRSLQTFFLPRIAHRIRQLMVNNLENLDTLPKFLQAYRMFQDTSKMDVQLIKAIMEADWENAPKRDKAQLLYYLDIALRAPILPIVIDEDLMEGIRAGLSLEDPIEEIYNELKEESFKKYSEALIPNNEGGKYFYTTFVSQGDAYSIPMLYTKKGFLEFYSKQAPLLIQKLITENKDMGVKEYEEIPTEQLKTFLSQGVLKRYIEDYINYWQGAYEDLRIIKPFDIDDQIEILNQLVQEDSPLINILMLIQQNTAIDIGGKKVQETFNRLNSISSPSSQKASQLSTILTSLATLRDYLQKIKHSPDPSKAMFETAKLRYLDTHTFNPLSNLILEATSLPPPLNTWLSEIAHNTWSLILEGAREHINDRWQSLIVESYTVNFAKRYPFNKESKDDVSLINLAKFFGPQGDLNTFIKAYIEPFVDINKNPWQEHLMDHQRIGINKEHLEEIAKLQKITSLFFPENSTSPSIKIQVLPHTLSSNSMSVELAIGKQVLLYRYEPLIPIICSWPQEQSYSGVSLEFKDFNNQLYRAEFEGIWSFFRFLDSGSLQPINSTDAYRFKINIGKFNATFDLSSPNSNEIFNLTLLREVKLPNKLIINVIN